MIWTLDNLVHSFIHTQTKINDKYVASRPVVPSFGLLRLRAAWLVLTGRADAVTWPENQ
jgi:hypothetical protein